MKIKKYSILLILVLSIFPLMLCIPSAQAYSVETDSRTVRTTYQGIWAETTLEVEKRTYSGGRIYFSYNFFTSRGKPSYFKWYPSRTNLYERDPDYWVAANDQSAMTWLLPGWVINVKAEVHFDENTLKFYGYRYYRDNFQQVVESYFEFIGSFGR